MFVPPGKSCSPPSLPDDVVDHILAFASMDTLLACSLVARSWLPLAQRRIFHDIQISVAGSSRASQSFRNLLHLFSTTSPHLARYARHIFFMVVLRDQSWETSDVEQQLCLLLEYFERLSSARIAFDLSNWTPGMVHSLQKLVSRPTLESLSFTLLGKRMVGGHVAEADILSYSFDGGESGDFPSTINLAHLETLDLRFPYPLAHMLHTPNLRTFSMRILVSGSQSQDIVPWSTTIPRVPLSVTHLTMELVVDTPQSGSCYEFPSFGDYANNIEHLTVITRMEISELVQERSLEAIITLFSEPRHENLLDLRTVILQLHFPTELDAALQRLQPSDTWALLDARLAALVSSGRLGNVLFDLQFSDYLRPSNASFSVKLDRTPEVSKLMQDCLPHISRSNTFNIKVSES
ncbi:hypothetical protein ONZ45_g18823 [Pleurotus djamor]|nr:hypothetical protein ONZ45_g18823 [Pleurotus djamor]